MISTNLWSNFWLFALTEKRLRS